MNSVENLHLANTLYETKDLPSLYRMFTKRGALGRNLNRLHRYMQGALKTSSSRTVMKDLARGFREGQLQWSFGIMPTIGDMRDIHEELKRRAPRKRRTSVTVKDSYTTNSRFIRNNGALSGIDQLEQTEKSERVWGARIEYNPPENRYLTDFFAGLENGINEYIGMNPLTVIWEAIPFSFAVDWLLSVDRLLDTIWLNNNPNVVCQYWKSEKISLDQKFSCQYLSLYQTSTNQHISDYTVRESKLSDSEFRGTCSAYNRMKMDAPSPLQALELRAGLKQVYLAALIATGFIRK
jgi:hypothetical protein